LTDNDANPGGITKTGPGTLVLSGASTFGGATTVNAGTLVVTGSLNAISPVAITAGTLGGTGFVGNTTIGDGVGAAGSAIFAPGGDGTIGAITTGSLSLANNDALFKFELNSTDLTADTTNLIGTLALGPGLAGFNGTDLLTAVLAGGTQFTLATSTDGITGFFNGYAEGASYALGANTYRISYGIDVPNGLTLTVVPEPASGALLLGALGILPAVRRRRAAR
jgi:autotransporter-associated beta strand protein